MYECWEFCKTNCYLKWLSIFGGDGCLMGSREFVRYGTKLNIHTISTIDVRINFVRCDLIYLQINPWKTKKLWYLYIQNCASFWKNAGILNVSRLDPSVRLVRAKCRWRWAWSTRWRMMTGEKNKVLGEKTCPNATLSTTNFTQCSGIEP